MNCLLAERVGRPGFADGATALVGEIAAARDTATMHACFCAGVEALGAERGSFVCCEPAGQGSVSYRVQSAGSARPATAEELAGETEWGRRYLDDGLFQSDPWLAYAQHGTGPINADTLELANRQQQAVRAQAAAAGFTSALLVPSHAPMRRHCFGLLVLGHSQPGWFSGAETLQQLRICARALAVELQEWWLAKSRRDRLATIPISALELQLLTLQRRGETSAGMARALGMTTTSVNSRFQRLNARLGHRNRGLAAQWAADCGLIAD